MAFSPSALCPRAAAKAQAARRLARPLPLCPTAGPTFSRGRWPQEEFHLGHRAERIQAEARGRPRRRVSVHSVCTLCGRWTTRPDGRLAPGQRVRLLAGQRYGEATCRPSPSAGRKAHGCRFAVSCFWTPPWHRPRPHCRRLQSWACAVCPAGPPLRTPPRLPAGCSVNACQMRGRAVG